MGLKYIYCTPAMRREVFKILEEMVPEGTDASNGRPGMLLWKIFVLGHIAWVDEYLYPIQTIKGNVSLLPLR